MWHCSTAEICLTASLNAASALLDVSLRVTWANATWDWPSSYRRRMRNWQGVLESPTRDARSVTVIRPFFCSSRMMEKSILSRSDMTAILDVVAGQSCLKVNMPNLTPFDDVLV